VPKEGCISIHVQYLRGCVAHGTHTGAIERVCRKCAVRFGPMFAKVRLFNTGVKRFRAGLVWVRY
jgi:hypothetical protein